MGDDTKMVLNGRVTKAYRNMRDKEDHIGAEVTLLVLPGQEDRLPEPWQSMARRQMPAAEPADPSPALSREGAER